MMKNFPIFKVFQELVNDLPILFAPFMEANVLKLYIFLVCIFLNILERVQTKLEY